MSARRTQQSPTSVYSSSRPLQTTQNRLPTPPSASSPVAAPDMPRVTQQFPSGTSRYDALVADYPKPEAIEAVSPQIVPESILPPVYYQQETERTIVNGYGILNEGGEVSPIQITRRGLYPNDVQIDIHFCGICHSDIHHAYNEWKDSMYPICFGHEITGVVSNIGSEVTQFQIGDRVAVGNLVNSCRVCQSCVEGHEQYCVNGGPSWVYNSHERLPGELFPTGELTFGGYSEMIVVNEDFVLKLPDELDLACSAPLLCAGITVWTPLIQNKVGPGTIVGIAGIGGLGSLGVKLAKAMGATVVTLSRSPWKIKDSNRLGADYSLLTSDDSQMRKAQGTIDLILDTIPQPHDINLYINLLKPGGIHWILGTLEPIQSFNAKNITNMNRSVSASNVGGIPSTKDMLQFCADNNIEADIELVTFDQIRECFDRVRAGDVRYRFVIDVKSQRL